MSGDAQRRLILHMAVSLDGFVARSDGGGITPRGKPHANLLVGGGTSGCRER
jgi:hypothetical protein